MAIPAGGHEPVGPSGGAGSAPTLRGARRSAAYVTRPHACHQVFYEVAGGRDGIDALSEQGRWATRCRALVRIRNLADDDALRSVEIASASPPVATGSSGAHRTPSGDVQHRQAGQVNLFGHGGLRHPATQLQAPLAGLTGRKL